MKVCYVTHLPNLTGANQSLLDLLRALEGSEVEPVVLLGRHGPLEDELKARGIRYRVIRFANELKKDDSRLHTLRKDLLNLWAKRNVKDFLTAEGVDLVHNNSMFVGIGMQASEELGIPYIAHIRDYVEEDHGLKLEHPKAQAVRVQNADAAIAVSRSLATVAASKYGTPKTGILPLYDGIDVDRFYLAPEERKTPCSGETVELLLAGRIQPGKGQLDAVNAVSLLEKEFPGKYRLTLVGTVGDEAYEKQLREAAEGAPVTILPFVEDLKELRKNTDIALVCSTHEAMGRVTIESLLAGLPVIGANGGATPELLDEERGALYEAGNAEDLARAIAAIDTKAVASAQTYAKERFGLKDYAAQVLNLYQEVV